MLREDLAIPRRELAFDAGASLGRLRGLIEDDRDVDETDLEFRGARLETEGEHHAQETDSGRDVPGQEDWVHGQKLVPMVSWNDCVSSSGSDLSGRARLMVNGPTGESQTAATPVEARSSPKSTPASVS